MLRAGLDPAQARARLEAAEGSVEQALGVAARPER
jgi:hypothetical protein